MDVDAVIRRAPELALIDELAHTNAPGMRNEKRYQDIDEVLDAGIDVISTVNVQHLESLNDAIAELTDVRVRETFPDRILDEADEVVLVDLTPRRSRSACGRARSTRGSAPRSRCRTSSGSRSCRALRELALREVAEDVEARRQAHRARPAAASRRSPSACSCSSRRSRARSGCCGARGARPSGSAPSSTRSGCASPARQLDRRGAGRRSPRCAASRSSSAPTSSRRRATTSSRPCAASSTSAASTYVFVGTPDESRRREILARLARLGARPRAARASTSASSRTAPTGGADGVSALDVVLLVAVVALARRAGAVAPAASAEGSPSPRAPAASSSRSPASSTRRVLDAAIRIARAEEAVLVPAYLAASCRCGTPRTRRCGTRWRSAMPLLEAVEHAALRAGVPVDARIEKGRTLTHALRRLWEVEQFDRIVAPAPVERRTAASPRRSSPGC